jgi:hypothetical protein
MRTLRKRIVGIIVGLALTAMLIAVVTNPLRKPETSIKLWLQEKTPLGTSLTNVQRTIDSEGWYNPKHQGSDGYAPEIYLRGELGGYWGFPFYVSVTVFWEFDKDRILRNVRILKTVDGV